MTPKDLASYFRSLAELEIITGDRWLILRDSPLYFTRNVTLNYWQLIISIVSAVMMIFFSTVRIHCKFCKRSRFSLYVVYINGRWPKMLPCGTPNFMSSVMEQVSVTELLHANEAWFHQIMSKACHPIEWSNFSSKIEQSIKSFIKIYRQ